MKTKEQIIRRMKSLSKEVERTMIDYYNMPNNNKKRNEERDMNERDLDSTLNQLRELRWVCGTKYDKFINDNYIKSKIIKSHKK